jgi:hypothetical protein
MPSILKDFVLFQIGPYQVMGLFSKKANTRLKRILHYLPVLIIKKG